MPTLPNAPLFRMAHHVGRTQPQRIPARLCSFPASTPLSSWPTAKPAYLSPQLGVPERRPGGTFLEPHFPLAFVPQILCLVVLAQPAMTCCFAFPRPHGDSSAENAHPLPSKLPTSPPSPIANRHSYALLGSGEHRDASGD
eukprot:GGOE01010178.1.p3 GENE.GGOE01010178.1~~GGOE01010178.1.p3  ORF type:complete len:141 (+),score=7.62 GGOE01010178.1:1320-1742(+)